MSRDLMRYSDQTFEDIKHINEYGQEYWLARELQTILGYNSWRRFSDAIERAKLACKNSGYEVDEQFADAVKTSPIFRRIERDKDSSISFLQRILECVICNWLNFSKRYRSVACAPRTYKAYRSYANLGRN